MNKLVTENPHQAWFTPLAVIVSLACCVFIFDTIDRPGPKMFEKAMLLLASALLVYICIFYIRMYWAKQEYLLVKAFCIEILGTVAVFAKMSM